MAVYRRSSRTRNVLAVLVLAALTLITIDARSNGSGALTSVRGAVSDAFSPLQRATHAALAPIGNFLTGAIDYGSLRAENQKLRQEVAGLQSQAVSSSAAEQQYKQLLQEMNLPFVGSIPTVAVQIIDQGFSNFDNSLTINKGTASGIAAGQPVVAAGGLVGTVLAATSHTATVRLLTDPSFAVGVGLQGGNVASASGQGRFEPMRVTIDSTKLPAPVMKVGDTVVTTGLSLEKFPKGIPVGKVSKVSTPPGAAEPTIELAPLVNPTRLSYLQVLLWSPA
ncbi:MAG TPA: rod shape-determining protein MreC [Acidimicrobiales bacterium]|nr:rod shape-determining protein MreC [Acidimicrobiales bacterium]